MLIAITAIVAVYWIISQVVNVYQQPVAGAVYEILWAPMVVFLFGVPIFSFICFARDKFRIGTLYFLSFILSLALVLFLILG